MWEHLDIDKTHTIYLCLSLVCVGFLLISNYIKTKLFLSEAIILFIFGIILGPYCLNWSNPSVWTKDTEKITIEFSRIILCIQLFVSGVELPNGYMFSHIKSVSIILLPVMTAGWLTSAVFIYLIVPDFKFKHGLLVAGCITATDPVLCQSIVSGKYAQKYVPKRLRDLIVAEAGSNDGMAYPFVYLSTFLLIFDNNKKRILKDFFLITVLYECVLGIFIGLSLGYLFRKTAQLGWKIKLMDSTSMLIYYIFVSILMAGLGSTLGIDELLLSFFAGCMFGWDGWFRENFVQAFEVFLPSIDYLLNLLYFGYLGCVIPWSSFNNVRLSLNPWRLVLIGLVIIFLRRLPSVLFIHKWIPEIKTLKEAVFVGWFGPIGVGAIFTSLLAKSVLEIELKALENISKNEEKIKDIKLAIDIVWILCTFIVVVSISIHGLSVPLIMLHKKYKFINFGNLSKKFNYKTSEIERIECQTICVTHIESTKIQTNRI